MLTVPEPQFKETRANKIKSIKLQIKSKLMIPQENLIPEEVDLLSSSISQSSESQSRSIQRISSIMSDTS